MPRKFQRIVFPDPLVLKYEFGTGGDWNLEQDFRVFWADGAKEYRYVAEAGLIGRCCEFITRFTQFLLPRAA